MIPARTEADPRYGISNLEVYANRPHETQVYISWVRASIDIEKHLVNGFLSNYGQVNRHFPMKDSEGVETFEHCFMMKACDLMKNPPPNFVWLGKKKLRVRYRGQVATCFICDSPDHLVHDCPKKKKREIDNQKTFNLNNKVDYPGLESNEEKGKEGHPVQNSEENKENKEVVEVEEIKESEQEDTEEGKKDEQSTNDVINHQKRKKDSSESDESDENNKQKSKKRNNQNKTIASSDKNPVMQDSTITVRVTAPKGSKLLGGSNQKGID